MSVAINAVNAGDANPRNKFSGYQIVATTAPAAVTTAPGAPTGIAAVAGNNNVVISWNATNTATSYTIKRATTPGGPYTTIASNVDPASVSYTDATAANGTNYYYIVTASNGIGESSASAETSGSPYDPSLVRAVSVNLRSINSYGMAWSDVAGIRRVDHWNNLRGPSLLSQSVTLSNPKNNLGVMQTGLSATFTAGTTSTSYDLSGTLRFDTAGAVQSGGETEVSGGNETNLYTTAFDQYNGTASSLSVTGVPYSNYDVVFYVCGESSTTRGGSITIGGTTKYVRSGAGIPTSTGFGYVEGTATTNSGSSTTKGNYVRFSGMTGTSFSASLVALNMGDSTTRLKISGFQIISNDTVTVTTPTVVPDAPLGVAAYPGNAQVSIVWQPSSTATSYQVKRGGSVLATVTTPFADSPTSYVDATAANGTTYSYTVAAVNVVGTGADSLASTATPSLPGTFEAPLPAEWQYSIPVSPLQSDYVATVTPETERRAYLWVPPGCTQVRAVLFSMQNMIELKMLESAQLRAALTAQNMGIIWLSSSAGANMDMIQDPANGPTPVATTANNNGDKSAQAAVEEARVLAQLAAESGYSEIAYCPIISFQHSASSPFGWTREVFAKPALAGRVISIINKGYYPGNAPRGIPSLHLTSEWSENAVTWGTSWDALDAGTMRKLRGQQGATTSTQPGAGTQVLLGECLQVGQGHYQADFMSDSTSQPLFIDFITKTAAARLPATWDGASYPTLTALDQTTTGAFIDVQEMGTGNATAMTLAQWQTAHPDDLEAKRAFWYIDLPYAQAIAAYANAGFNKKPQMITPVNPNGTFQNLFGVMGAAEYYPTIMADGISFQVKAAHINQSPSFRQFFASPLEIGSAPIKYIHTSGALRQVGPDTFQMWVDRGPIQQQSLPWDNFISAYERGDDTHRSVDRPIHVNIPILNTTGAAQAITFPTIPNQIATNMQPVTLAATASSGLPVQYWMIAGSYRALSSSLPNSTLTPQTLPAKVTFPMRVMVGAYQWGTRAGTQYQASSAKYQTFWIFQDGFQKWQYETFGSLSGSATGAADEQRTWNTLPANAADTADPDGDGITNLHEYIAGTNPNDSGNYLKVSQMQADGNDMLLSFGTVSGKTYRLERSDTLQAGSWTTVQDNITGTGYVVQIRDTGGAALHMRFYRIVASTP